MQTYTQSNLAPNPSLPSMPVGPELPPHLSKRKRDSGLDSSDSGSEKRKRITGPTLPPKSLNPNEINLDSDDSSEDDGPQPAAAIGPTLPAAPVDEAPRPRVIGPSMPPPEFSPESDGEAHGKIDQEESDSEDDIGPALPSAALAPIDGTEASDMSASADLEARTDSTKLQRDDWMLAAPSGGDWTSRVDPTKLRNRKFNTSSKAGATSAGAGGKDMWSETPEQKRQRLQNQVLGIATPEQGDSRVQQPDRPARTEEDEEKERRIREYNEKHRGQSLYEQHQKNQDKEEEDDPSKRAFDREKDIGGSRVGFAKKRELMGRAADFGSRFSKGSYL